MALAAQHSCLRRCLHAQLAASDAACEAARQLRALGGALALLLQLDSLLRVKGASDFLVAGPLLGISPAADGQLEHPVSN